MKKTKIFFCLAALLLAGGMAFAGCQPQTEETISLAEAKTLIVNSLEVEDAASAEEKLIAANQHGNRNVFVKLITADVAFEGNFDFGTTITGSVERKNDAWTQYSLESGIIKEYYTNGNVYSKQDSLFEQTNFENSYFGIILQSMDCVYVDFLFLEDAWNEIYRSTVTRKHDKTDYSLTMDIDMAKYVDYVMAKAEEKNLGAEGLFGEGSYLQKNKDEGSVDVVVHFDKNHNIIGLDYTIVSLGSDWNFYTTKLNISKSENNFAAPEWFNIADFQN